MKGFQPTLRDEVKTAVLKKVAIPIQKPELSSTTAEAPTLELDPHRRPLKRFPLKEILEEGRRFEEEPDPFQDKDFEEG